MNLKGRDFLCLLDYTPEEIEYLLDVAEDFKQKKKNGIPHRVCEGKSIALIFEKNSTRTRCAFEVAANDLGIHPVFLDPVSSQMGKKESIEDTARVLCRMFDGIEYRGYGQERVEALAKYSDVPVWNGLTNEFHPTQILADLLTIREHFGTLKGIKFVFLGDGRYNMANSLMIGCAKMGMDFVISSKPEYFPQANLIEKCREICAVTGGSITLEENPEKAVENANVLYTDVWVSMGENPEVWDKRINDLSPYCVTSELMKKANANCVFMHCLPSFHDTKTEIGMEISKKYGITCMEVTDEVFESPVSLVFEEAENRMHTIKAVIAVTI